MTTKSERDNHHPKVKEDKDGMNLDNLIEIKSDNSHSGGEVGKKYDLNAKKRKKNLTNEERSEIAKFLLLNYNNNRLEKFSISKAADKFSVHRSTIHRIWVRAKETLKEGSTVIDVSSRKKGMVRRRKPKDSWTVAIEKIQNIPMSSLHSLSCTVQIPKTSLHRLVKNNTIKRRKRITKAPAKSHSDVNVLEKKESNNNDQSNIDGSSTVITQVVESLKDLDSCQIFEVQKFISHLKETNETAKTMAHRSSQDKDNNNKSLLESKSRIYKY